MRNKFRLENNVKVKKKSTYTVKDFFFSDFLLHSLESTSNAKAEQKTVPVNHILSSKKKYLLK